MSDYFWSEPITDRTAKDIEEARRLIEKPWAEMAEAEKATWNAGLKGVLNRKDLVRIERNIHILSDVLELNLTTKEDIVPLIPNINYINGVRNNVDKIRKAWTTYDNTPKTPAMPLNTYQKINDIEQILADVYTILASNFFYDSSDNIVMGEAVGLVL